MAGMNSTSPRFPRDPVIIGRVLGPETYDPRAKPGVQLYEPEKKSQPFASATQRFPRGASAYEQSLGPGSYKPNYNAAISHSGLIAVHDHGRQSAPFASKLDRFNALGVGKGPEATPPPYFDPARESDKWRVQPSLAAAWGRAKRWDAKHLRPYPHRPDYYNVDVSTAVPRMAVLTPLTHDYVGEQRRYRELEANGLLDEAGRPLSAKKRPDGSAAPPALDYSFQELHSLAQLLSEAPVEDGAGRLPPMVTLPRAEAAEAQPAPGRATSAAARAAAAAAAANGPAAAAAAAAASGADEEGAQAEAEERRWVASALRLDNNALSTVEELPDVLPRLVLSCDKVVRLDLASNRIVTLGGALLCTPHLVSLRLHDNAIADLAELRSLLALPELRALTAHGNPLAEGTAQYRLLLLAALPQLRTLDTSTVTERERQARDALGSSAAGRKALKPLYAAHKAMMAARTAAAEAAAEQSQRSRRAA